MIFSLDHQNLNFPCAVVFCSGAPNPSADVIRRASRAFSDEFPKLRIFSHPNILPVIGCTNSPPNLIVVNQWMPYGSLYHVLHEQSGIVVDQTQALKFAIDVARGMAFLHTLDVNIIEKFYLNSKHVYVRISGTITRHLIENQF